MKNISIGSNINFNVILPIITAFSLFGLYWLSRLGLEAGNAYLLLLILGMVFLVFCAFAKLSGTNFWFEIPINKGNYSATLALFLGMITLFLMEGISSLAGLNFYSPFAMAPLAQFGTAGLTDQSFATLATATSNFWTFFIIVISASVIEEIVLGWAFVNMGSLTLGYGLRTMLNLDFGDNGGENSGNQIWDFAMAMIFSITLFAILHFFNSTYIDPTTGKMKIGLFAFALMFRLFLNIAIYKFANLGLMYSIGVHAINNALFLGAATVTAALLSFPGGVILDALFILLIFYTITNFKQFWQAGEMFAKDFLTFD